MDRWRPPTRAELFCDPTTPNCKDATKILQLKNVPTAINASPNNTVTLVYERILARDCNQRYVDTGFSMYNVPAAAFGCSISANMVQHVSDKREFINPSLSDDPSAKGAVSSYRRAYTPKTDAPVKYGVGNSTVSSAGGSSGGGQ